MEIREILSYLVILAVLLTIDLWIMRIKVRIIIKEIKQEFFNQNNQNGDQQNN